MSQTLFIECSKEQLRDFEQKRATMRAGFLDVRPGLLLVSAKPDGPFDAPASKPVVVTSSISKKFAELNEEDLRDCGYRDLDEARKVRRHWDPSFKDEDFVTIIRLV